MERAISSWVKMQNKAKRQKEGAVAETLLPKINSFLSYKSKQKPADCT